MKLLILFEGLGYLLSPFISASHLERRLAIPIKAEYEQHGWLERAAPCPTRDALVVSHGYGAMRAREFAERCRLDWVSIDPRRFPWGGGITAPKEITVINIWRKGFQRGYPIDGVINMEAGPLMTHTGLPENSNIRAIVQNVMGHKGLLPKGLPPPPRGKK